MKQQDLPILIIQGLASYVCADDVVGLVRIVAVAAVVVVFAAFVVVAAVVAVALFDDFAASRIARYAFRIHVVDDQTHVVGDQTPLVVVALVLRSQLKEKNNDRRLVENRCATTSRTTKNKSLSCDNTLQVLLAIGLEFGLRNLSYQNATVVWCVFLECL
uniref:Uncharacterized protein n=1 Tax=Parascaris equorum TaxID=6256 RepID=A0A914RDF0_PAREQ